MTRLKMSAENILVSVVSKGNCIWYLTLADKYHTSELQKAATKMIVSNLAEVRKTEDWVTIRPNLKERVLEEISNHYNLVEKIVNDTIIVMIQPLWKPRTHGAADSVSRGGRNISSAIPAQAGENCRRIMNE